MENNDHSEVKLLNKDINVTNKDVYEFNAWIKGKKITPKLMEEFDNANDYEDFMLDYDETQSYSVAKISLDTPNTYVKGSEGYEYLSSVDQAIYDQIITDLNKNGLQIEYDSVEDEFKVYSDSKDPKNFDLKEGVYDRSTDDYKMLSSLDPSGVESLQQKLNENNMEIVYDSINDKFSITKKCSSKSHQIFDPGTYEKGSKEYEYLDKFEEEDWIEYLDEMAESGLSVDYDNLEDAFVVTDSSTYSNQKREKVSAADLKKAEEEGVVQKKPNGKWGIISIDAKEWWIPDYDTKENAEAALAAYHANKGFSTLSSEDTITDSGTYIIYFEERNVYKIIDVKPYNIDSVNDSVKEWPGNFVLYKAKNKKDAINHLVENGFVKHGEDWVGDEDESYSRNFTTKEIDSVTVETTNPDQLYRILETIKSHGNGGHSFEIAIDYKDERQETFGWDGDGSDRIENIKINKSITESKNFAKDEFDVDIAKAVFALMIYDDFSWFQNLGMADFDEMVEILEDAIKDTFPNDKSLYDKASSLMNKLIRIGDKNTRSF